MVRLIVKKYDGREEIFSSLESETLIGRDDPTSGIINHINFSDNTVSRHHAKIYFEQHYFYIEDMDSSNGTWVNEHRIKKVKLLPGDKVSIGRNIIIFESEGTRTLNPLDFIVDEEKLDHKKTIDSNYFILQKLSRLLTVTTNLEDFLQSVIQMIMESIKASKGALILLDEEGKQKNIVTTGEKVVFSEEAVKQVLRPGRPSSW
ncbi:MAG: FHA domain-containing protein [Syntrophobacterales bacterium]